MSVARRSRDATKQLLLDAGAEVLLRDGVSVGASTIRYTDAFDLLADRGIKVTRGSVHERIWPSQEAWQLEVIGRTIAQNEERRRAIVSSVINEHIPSLPIDTPDQRRHVLAESCRVGSLAFLDELRDTPNQRLFPIVIAAWKASSGRTPEHAALGELLKELQRVATDRVQVQIGSLVDYLGLEVNPVRGMSMSEATRAFCATTTALAYSQTIRIAHDPTLLETFEARCPDGEYRSWNSLGIGNWLVARGLFTVDEKRVGS